MLVSFLGFLNAPRQILPDSHLIILLLLNWVQMLLRELSLSKLLLSLLSCLSGSFQVSSYSRPQKPDLSQIWFWISGPWVSSWAEFKKSPAGTFSDLSLWETSFEKEDENGGKEGVTDDLRVEQGKAREATIGLPSLSFSFLMQELQAMLRHLSVDYPLSCCFMQFLQLNFKRRAFPT